VLINGEISPFRFFQGLAEFWRKTTMEKMLRPEAKTKLLYQYLRVTFPGEDEYLFYDLLKLDWLFAEPRHTLPQWLGGGQGQDRIMNISEFLPWARGMTPKEIYKKASVVKFHYYFIMENGKIKNYKKQDCRAIIDYSKSDRQVIFT